MRYICSLLLLESVLRSLDQGAAMKSWKLSAVFVILMFISFKGSEGNKLKNPSPQSINDGHRLITRALWRIFDAIMEKKNHDTLYGRMKFVEGALNDMLTSDSSLDNKVDALTTTLKDQHIQLTTLSKQVEKIKNLEERIREIEDWQLRLERPRDEDSAKDFIGVIAQPVFSECPSPYKKVGGECMFISTAKKLGWRDARRACARISGDLASPRDLPALRAFLKSMSSASRPEYVWMGGSKTSDEQWVWSSGNQLGTPIDMSQDTWNEKLPEGAGNCMGLYERAGYKAYDYACKEKDYFICQKFF